MRNALQLQQSASLTLTPELKQSLKILSLSNAELEQELKDLSEKNPFLELGDAGTSLLNSENRSNNSDSDDNILTSPRETSLSEVKPSEWRAGRQGEQSYRDYENIADQIDFRDHLKQQLISNNTSKRDSLIIHQMIDYLDEDGFLRENFEDFDASFFEETGCTIEDFERCRVTLQGLDPIGAGTYNMAEYLSLQIDTTYTDKNLRNLLKQVVNRHIDILAAKNYRKIANLVGCEIEKIYEASRIIAGLNPKPLDNRWTEGDTFIKPDLVLEKINNEWKIRLSRDYFADIRINEEYADVLSSSQLDSASPLRDYFKQARVIQKNIKQRHETVLRVGQEIFKHQVGFLKLGPKGLIPMTLQVISDSLELHESTISRATSRKYIQTPRGTFELKYFFSSAVGEMNDTSSTLIKDLIKTMIKLESPSKPLSDSKIQSSLSEKGIKIARRTVAKYRDSLKILPSKLRKKIE